MKMRSVNINKPLRSAIVLVVLFGYPISGLLISNVNAASGLWTQTNWDGGSGQTAWSNSNQFFSSDNIDFSTNGEIKLVSNEVLPLDWLSEDWQFRKKLEINPDQISGTDPLIDFPFLVSFASDSDLATSAQPDAADIVFTSGDGTTLLNFEIEKFDESTGELYSWVSIPSVSATSITGLYMYYGNSDEDLTPNLNPEDVWVNYGLVHHFDETSGQHIDSTDNNNDTESVDVAVQGSADGKIGGADQFTTGNGFVSIPDNPNGSLDLVTDFTISAWVNPISGGGGFQVLNLKGTDGGVRNYSTYLNFDNVLISWVNGGFQDYSAGGTPIEYDQWNYVSYRRVGDFGNDTLFEYLYVNGVQMGSRHVQNSQGQLLPNDEDLVLGRQPDTSNQFWGIMDEMRISDSGFTPEYINAEYNNQNDPSAFYTLSDEETPGSEIAPWFDEEWIYRKQITIDPGKVQGSADILNFPILVKLDTDTSLANNAQSDAADIVFTASDGETPLEFEIETFDEASGELIAWVVVPTLSGALETDVYMYYGNPDGDLSSTEDPQSVWDTNYDMVLHLSETTGQHFDSTSHGNNTTTATLQDQSVDGIVGNADQFSASTGQLIIPDNVDGSLDLVDDFTISFWVNPLSGGGGEFQLFMTKSQDGDDPTNYGIYLNFENLFVAWHNAGARQFNTGSNPINYDEWNLVTYRRDADTQYLYANGVLVLSGSSTTEGSALLPNNDSLKIGRQPFGFPYVGLMDEIRFSNNALTPEYIATEYNNISDPSNFYELSDEETEFIPFAYESDGNVISSIFDSTAPSTWGNLNFAATTDSGTSISLAARSSNSSTMSGATDFSLCDPITSGTDISSNNCITDSQRYIQYAVFFETTDSSKTPTFTDITIAYETEEDPDPVPPPPPAPPVPTPSSEGGDTATNTETIEEMETTEQEDVVSFPRSPDRGDEDVIEEDSVVEEVETQPTPTNWPLILAGVLGASLAGLLIFRFFKKP